MSYVNARGACGILSSPGIIFIAIGVMTTVSGGCMGKVVVVDVITDAIGVIMSTIGVVSVCLDVVDVVAIGTICTVPSVGVGA